MPRMGATVKLVWPCGRIGKIERLTHTAKLTLDSGTQMVGHSTLESLAGGSLFAEGKRDGKLRKC